MYESRLKNGLKWKYRIQHFLEVTEKGKECLWTLVTFTGTMAVATYFIAHWLLYITNFYKR